MDETTAPSEPELPAPDSIPAIPEIPTAPAHSPVATAPAHSPVATAPAHEPAAAAPTRKIWPWVLGGSILAFLLIAGSIVVAVLVFIGQTNGPTATVMNFDKAYKNSDCELFKSTTTNTFQDGFSDNGFDCTQWLSIADGFHDNGAYNYTVTIKTTQVHDSTATITTVEHDTTPGSEKTYDLVYSLVKSNGTWLIDSLSTSS